MSNKRRIARLEAQRHTAQPATAPRILILIPWNGRDGDGDDLPDEDEIERTKSQLSGVVVYRPTAQPAPGTTATRPDDLP